MTPERLAELAARWVRLYTRNLPAPVARRRVEEIDADLHDHIAHERTQGTSDRRIALSILSRLARGVAADAAWRGHHVDRRTAHASTMAIGAVSAFVLVAHAVAMQVTDEVAWGPGDFAFAAALFAGVGLINEVTARTAVNAAFRAAVGVALGAALMLVWVSVAVGIVGETGDPADLMYAGVLAVGTLGAVIARFRPRGMARALLATAVAQALAAVVALILGRHQAPISSLSEIVGLNGLFVVLFLASAWLFHRADRTPARAPRGPAVWAEERR